jgi:hypothetical protein
MTLGRITSACLILVQDLISAATHVSEFSRRTVRSRGRLMVFFPLVHMILRTFVGRVLAKDFDFLLLVLHDIVDLYIDDRTEQCPFTFNFSPGEIKLVHGASQAVCAVGNAWEFASQPRVLETFIDRNSLLNIHSEHSID